MDARVLLKSSNVQHGAIDALLGLPPYGSRLPEKKVLLLAALNEAYRHHVNACPSYRRFCSRRGFGTEHVFSSLEEMPFLPAQAFKQNADMLISVNADEVYRWLHSSATSGTPSTVAIDKITAKRQVRALTSVVSAVLGPQRRLFLVQDVDPRTVNSGAVGIHARSAAVRGFLNLAREVRYFMELGPRGELFLKEAAFIESIQSLCECPPDESGMVIFGFTYVLYQYMALPLLKAKQCFKLPEGSHIVHIGGWKKLIDAQVSKDRFNTVMGKVFGVRPEAVIDVYGFTEQMGVIYPDSQRGEKCTPVFADVLVRNPRDFTLLPDGEEGLLEFLTPLPHSYPGIAVLTDDVGVITGRATHNSEGWHGTYFQVLGRARRAEPRGCGDVTGEKVVTSNPEVDPGSISRSMRYPAVSQSRESDVRLLFDGTIGSTAGLDAAESIDFGAFPRVTDLDALVAQLKENRRRLDTYSCDDLIALVSAAAQRWNAGDASLAALRQQGLQFLVDWCRAPALRRMSDQALRGARSFLDHPRTIDGSNRRLLMAQPRGLVGHWLAGNVPVLGMLSLVQSILTRNANLVKAARSFSMVLPRLLEVFRGLEVVLHSGRRLKGNDVLASIAVVYFRHDDSKAALRMSELCDVRLAWGGQEAVETILNMRKRYGTEDVIFGPKLSYLVIGRERLSDLIKGRRLARHVATDVSVFDQYACASPHTVFVEEGGPAFSPRDFAELLSDEMAKAAVRLPKAPEDLDTLAKINSVRLRQELMGDIWRSEGPDWTVLYDERSQGLAEPCYSRVIAVRAVDNILDTARFAHNGIQTIGMALDGARRLKFVRQAAALGVERFPDVGRMTFFDSPWDGLFLMDRLVRWVSIGGPF